MGMKLEIYLSGSMCMNTCMHASVSVCSYRKAKSLPKLKINAERVLVVLFWFFYYYYFFFN